MAKTKIRRSLFIGLGGTGMRTILYLKKLFIETYGEVPPMIGFLGIDTDKGEFSKYLEPKNTSSVGIMRNENLETTLFVKGTSPINEAQREKLLNGPIMRSHILNVYKSSIVPDGSFS